MAIDDRFTALEDFWSDETQSGYVEGFSYTIGGDKLDRLVQQWLKEGKVQIGGPAAKVTGIGG